MKNNKVTDTSLIHKHSQQLQHSQQSQPSQQDPQSQQHQLCLALGVSGLNG